MNNNRPHHTVVIVGAGMAGLGAARIIHASQTDFIILEAQNHPGGRIQTLQVGAAVIDLGAQWMHGTGTDLYAILQENHLIHSKTSDEGRGIYVRDDGHVVDEFLVQRVAMEVGRILEECETYLGVVTDSSVGEFLTEKFHDFVKNADSFSDEEKRNMLELFDWHVRFQVIDNSCEDLNMLSMKEWGRYACVGKDGQQHVNIKGGYGALVDVLVNALPPNAIRYNKCVQEVRRQPCGAVLITCKGGYSVQAQAVIITCSLGVLKTFAGLPIQPHVRTMIEMMGFASMGKVFLEFEHRWWRDDVEGFQILWRYETNSHGEFPDWLRHVSGFDSVLDQPKMLMTWVGHGGVKEMEDTDGEVVGKQCVQLLRRFLRDDAVPFPVKVYKSSWLTNPHIKGGYSHATTMCDCVPLPPGRVLADASVAEQNVFLAGEAVHESHFSTTHGAFESGQMQARQVLKHLFFKN